MRFVELFAIIPAIDNGWALAAFALALTVTIRGRS